MSSSPWSSWSVAAASLGLAVLLPFGAAQGQAVRESVSLEEVDALLARRGLRSSLAIDDWGDPVLSSEQGGVPLRVNTYECDRAPARQSCKTIQLAAYWQLGEPSAEAILLANRFNAELTLGRAYQNPAGDLILDMVIPLEGGVALAFIDAKAGLFLEEAVPRFLEGVVAKLAGLSVNREPLGSDVLPAAFEDGGRVGAFANKAFVPSP